jgi:hypothetical protein
MARTGGPATKRRMNKCPGTLTQVEVMLLLNINLAWLYKTSPLPLGARKGPARALLGGRVRLALTERISGLAAGNQPVELFNR